MSAPADSIRMDDDDAIDELKLYMANSEFMSHFDHLDDREIELLRQLALNQHGVQAGVDMQPPGEQEAGPSSLADPPNVGSLDTALSDDDEGQDFVDDLFSVLGNQRMLERFTSQNSRAAAAAGQTYNEEFAMLQLNEAASTSGSKSCERFRATMNHINSSCHYVKLKCHMAGCAFDDDGEILQGLLHSLTWAVPSFDSTTKSVNKNFNITAFHRYLGFWLLTDDMNNIRQIDLAGYGGQSDLQQVLRDIIQDEGTTIGSSGMMRIKVIAGIRCTYCFANIRGIIAILFCLTYTVWFFLAELFEDAKPPSDDEACSMLESALHFLFNDYNSAAKDGRYVHETDIIAVLKWLEEAKVEEYVSSNFFVEKHGGLLLESYKAIVEYYKKEYRLL